MHLLYSDILFDQFVSSLLENIKPLMSIKPLMPLMFNIQLKASGFLKYV